MLIKAMLLIGFGVPILTLSVMFVCFAAKMAAMDGRA